jgi:spermidine synthase
VFSFPWWLSLAIGFLSLSEEILWVRVVGFGYQTLPFAFSFVLAFYLVGIALGAAYGKRLCGRAQNLYAVAAVVLGVAALGDALTPVLIGRVIAAHAQQQALWLFASAIIIAAGLKSILFPIAHHLGSMAAGPQVGRSVSRIYFGNIIGATLGPLVTGFVALDHLNVDECFALIAALCLLISLGCVFKSARLSLIAVPLAAALILSAFASSIAKPGPGSLRGLAIGGSQLTHFSSNRHGVIHTVGTENGDYVFGTNVYDGIASVDVDRNANRLDRVYMLALMHPGAKHVLAIGMSTGAWVRAVQGFPGVEQIDVVEINPGYIDLLRLYPALAPLLSDPRIHIHIDDGRRWLKRNPDARFDLIIQNTTYHWRSNAGNLLSREYLENVKQHMNPGAVLTTNTTGSFDVLATMRAVFPYAYRYTNFGYASDRPLQPNFSLMTQIARPDGTPFQMMAPRGSVVAALALGRIEPVESFIARHQADARVISDDNLVTEYRHGRRFGPKMLQDLQPSEAPEFKSDEP